MRKTIVRTITETTIESAKVTFVGGKPVIDAMKPLTISGVITEEKALKEVRKLHGANVQVTAIVSIDDTYEISVDDFMKYAKKVVAKPEEVKEVIVTE